jgi:DNA-binding response OmpR family regulator
LVHGDAPYAAEACKRFRRQGWDVYQAQNGPEVRRLARMLEPELVVLEADLAGESGWLTCAKLTREQPGIRVFLVSDDAGPRNRQMALFSGAAGLINRRDSLLALVEPAVAMRPAA